VLSVRLTEAQAAKVDRLAAKTCRPRGAIIRYLIERARLSGIDDIELIGLAEATGLPDVRLRAEPPSTTGAA
jgi:predicted transcriptional regulator